MIDHTKHNNLSTATTKRYSRPFSSLHQPYSNIKGSRNENDIQHLAPLPNEIVTLIISHIKHLGTLYACTLVSKQFHDVANAFLWQALDFEDDRLVDSISAISPQRLATLGQFVRQLGLHGPRWTDSQLVRLLPHCSYLTTLAIGNTTAITDKGFQHVPLQYLESLTLALPCFSLSSFAALGRHGRLRVLNCLVWGNQEWLALLTSCPLESLTLMCDVRWNDDAAAALGSFDLVRLDLTSLDFRGIRFCWPRLTHLTLSPCLLDDATLTRVFRSHPCLTHLYLKMAQNMTAATLDAMTLWLPHLISVKILKNRTLTSADVRRWIKHSPSLTTIALQFCNQLDTGFPEAHHHDGRLIRLDKHMIDKIRLADH